MAAAEQNLEMDQGAYWSKLISWTDESDLPVDVTGYTARMQIRKKVDSRSSLLDLTTENGRITLGGTAGTILLEIEAEDTAELPATPTDHRWSYDLEMVPAGGKVVRLMQGKLIVSPEVTR